MKIILLGYMASGKSTIGKDLAYKLSLKFIDLDYYIEKHERLSITNIFKEKGEIYFRKTEHHYLKELLETDDSFILSLGGGTPCYSNNMKAIIDSERVVSIYLRANISTLTDRISRNKNDRPLVANLENESITEFIAKHLFERSEFYEKATIKVDVDHKTTEEVVDEIRIKLY